MLVVIIDQWGAYVNVYRTDIPARQLAALYDAYMADEDAIDFTEYATSATGLACEDANADIICSARWTYQQQPEKRGV